MKKAIQIITIGVAAYNLYMLVDDFLKTPTGKRAKDKVSEFAEPIIEQVKDYAEKVMDKMPESKDEVTKV